MEDKFVLYCISISYGILLGCIVDIYLFHYSIRVCHSNYIPKSSLSLLNTHWYKESRILRDVILGRNCVEYLEKHTIFFPWVEILMGFLLALDIYYYQMSFEFFSNIAFIVLLLAIAIVCNQTLIIPDEITYSGIVIGVLFSFVKGGVSPLNSIGGFLLGAGIAYLAATIGQLIFRRESLGGGAIKTFAMMGAFLGWERTLFTFFAASFFGSIFGLYLMVTKKVKPSRNISFGEFQGIGAIVALFWGNQIISWYIQVFL